MTGTLFFPELGSLDIVEVYEFYDEPILFSCRNESDRLYLAVLTKDNSDSRTWLYAPLSSRRLNHVRSGGVDLRDAFRVAEGGHVFEVVLVKSGDPTCTGRWVDASLLQDDQLPAAGERLTLETATLPVRPELESLRTAKQARRDILALRFTFPGVYRTEAPAGLLGQALDSLQQTLYAVGQAAVGRGTTRGSLPSGMMGRLKLSVASVYSGSFGVELHADEEADLFGDSTVSQALEEFVILLESTHNEEEMLSRLGELKGRTIPKYRDLLLRLGTDVHSVEFEWASPRLPETRTVTLPADVARNAASRLRQVTPEEEFDFDIFGTLVGFNSRTKTYEMWDLNENKKYTGKVADHRCQNRPSAGDRRGGVAALPS